MVYIYRIVEGKLKSCPIDIACEVGKELLWIDLVAPSDAERAFVEKYFKLPWISLGEEMEDIELTARFYEDPLGLHLLSLFLSESCQIPASNTSVRFIVQKTRIFSIRERELKAFSLYRARAQKDPMLACGSAHIHLLNLLEIKTELLADELEFIYRELDALNEMLLQEAEEQETYDFLLVWLAKLEASSDKLRLCLTDSQRALMFLLLRSRELPLPAQSLPRARDILGNIESLIPHNEAVCARIEFLTQTTMGFSEIRQNHTMKLMSRISVFALPPTIITAWLGMDTESFFGIQRASLAFQAQLFFPVAFFSYLFYRLMRRFRYF